MDGFRRTVCLLFASAALACPLGAGCTMDGSGGGNPGGDPYAGPAQPPERDIDGDAYVRQYDDDGYAPTPPPPRPVAAAPEPERQGPLVPQTARLAAEGRGDLSYKAKRDGYIYIVDRRDKKLIAQMPIDEGEEVLIAPYRNVIEIDGKRVKRVKDLDNKHIHDIYFERDSDSGRNRRDRERDRENR